MGETTWSHQNKEWQKTLDLARSMGWDAPRKLNDHGGLALTCPKVDPRHTIRVFSTGKGTESVAIDFRKKIRNCPHRDLTNPLASIGTSLDGAERLLDAAEGRLDVIQAEERMEELVEDLETAAAQLLAAQEEFDATAARIDEIKERLGDPFPDRSLQDLTRDAGTSLRTAKLNLRDDLPTEHEQWDALRARLEALTDRLARVRRRISEDGR